MSAESTNLPKINSSDSILSYDNANELISEQFESSKDVETHKSLENIFLDGPSFAADPDNSSLASRNESLLNFQMFEDETNVTADIDIDIVTASDNIDVVIGDGNKVLQARDTKIETKNTVEITTEERTDVGFEQPKVTKPLATADSTRSLMKFFIDSPAGVGEDLEGKNFFDSFTTVQDEEGLVMKSDEQMDVSSPTKTQVLMSTDVVGPFNSISSVDGKIEAQEKKTNFEDKNKTMISLNLERSRDVWLTSEKTRKSLLTVLYNGPNVIVPFPTSELTMPGVIIEESLGDPIRGSILKHIGEQEADKRLMLNIDSVPQDQVGLQQLIKADCLRAAVDLTSRLLTSCGQGPGKMNQLSTHTPLSMQLWFCRLSLLSHLHLYGPAECEWQPFGNLDNPDLYYEFHQSRYPGRKGSMVPFEMRILHAEFPQHLQRHQESLDRLYLMLFTADRIIKNLKSNLSEDGSEGSLSNKDKQESLSLWEQRELRILYCIANCLLNMKDHNNSLKIFNKLLTKDSGNQHDIHSAMGRIYLQVGDIERARDEFNKLHPSQFKSEKEFKIQSLINEAFVELGCSEFNKARQLFRKVYELDSQNVLSLNNLCVCSLYLERLKESLKNLELLVYTNPKLYLQEILVMNLCTLYELESSKANLKKQNLLRLVGQHRGTGFDSSCLKLT